MKTKILFVSLVLVVLFVGLSSFVDKGKTTRNSDIKQANIEALTGVSANAGAYASSLEYREYNQDIIVALSDGSEYRCLADKVTIVDCKGEGNYPCTMGEIRYENPHDCAPIYIAR